MNGFFHKIAILLYVFFFLIILQKEIRAQSNKILSVDIHTGLAFHQNQARALEDLYFEYGGDFTPGNYNWARGIRLRYGQTNQTTKYYLGIIAGYRSIDQKFNQQIQPSNFGILESNTNIHLSQHIFSSGLSLGRLFKGKENTNFGIQTNFEFNVPFLDVTVIETEVLRYLDDSALRYKYTNHTNNFQNSFENYESWLGYTLGLELSYTFFRNKWRIRPFICGEYMSINNSSAFISSVGLILK